MINEQLIDPPKQQRLERWVIEMRMDINQRRGVDGVLNFFRQRLKRLWPGRFSHGCCRRGFGKKYQIGSYFIERRSRRALRTQTRSRARWNAGACSSSATTSFNS